MRTLIIILVWVLSAGACQAEAICAGRLAGDVDEDCKVDFDDFAILAGDWMQSGTELEGDIDDDNDVDAADLSLLAEDWLAWADAELFKHVIMWVGAHPDDELFGAGCAFARYCADYEERGIFIAVTKGEAGGGPATGYALGEWRAEEARCSASGLNADIRYVNIWDGKVTANADLLFERMTRLIREVRPDVVITHGPEGEYGHSDHKAVSSGVTQAVFAAMDANEFPEQLNDGAGVWQTRKFYRIVEYRDTDQITLFVNGNEYSDKLGETYYELSDRVIRDCHWSQSGVFNVYPPEDHTNLSLVLYTIPLERPETDLLDGLSRDTVRALYLRDWLICGSFTDYSGDLDYDYLAEDGGETGIVPSAGMMTGGKIWTQQNSGRDYVNFRSIYEPNNYDAVAYAYGVIDSPAALEAMFCVSAWEGVKVWLNGALVHENHTVRDYDYADFVPITLTRGENRLLIKVKAGSRFDDWDDGPIVKPWGFFAKYE